MSKKLDLNKLTDEQLDTLIRKESVIIEQDQEKYIIIIPRNVTKDRNISVDDLIITEYSEEKVAERELLSALEKCKFHYRSIECGKVDTNLRRI